MSNASLDVQNVVSFETIWESDVRCANCGGHGMMRFYSAHDVPVHSCLLMDTRAEAMSFPRGNVSLSYCRKCGFIANTEFDKSRHQYSVRYEETQIFSNCFNKFARSLAERLVKQYKIYNKDILEIGCGKGDFLALLCEIGDNRGIGIDPSYVPSRHPGGKELKLTFIQDFYSAKYEHLSGDFICCRHTLEHIADTQKFLKGLRKAIGQKRDTIVFFEVPDSMRVLREGAFWDIYYEHCSYFTPDSLSRLFGDNGFDIVDLSLDFDDQYLLIVAEPADVDSDVVFDFRSDLKKLPSRVDEFRRTCARRIDHWHSMINRIYDSGERVVLWGSGSKGVAFLTTLGLETEVEYIVDINPHRQGKFMPGTGQQIVSPDFLRSYRPDYVIVMNPIYTKEIRDDLDRLNLKSNVKILSL